MANHVTSSQVHALVVVGVATCWAVIEPARVAGAVFGAGLAGVVARRRALFESERTTTGRGEPAPLRPDRRRRAMVSQLTRFRVRGRVGIWLAGRGGGGRRLCIRQCCRMKLTVSSRAAV